MAGLLTDRIERQGIAPNNVPLKDEPYRLAARFLPSSFEQACVVRIKYFEEPSSAVADIVRQNIDPVDRAIC